MATLTDLSTDLATVALTLATTVAPLGSAVARGWSASDARVGANNSGYSVKVVDTEEVRPNSNTERRIASAELRIWGPVSEYDSSTSEAVFNTAMEAAVDIATYVALASVSQSPLPEVSVSETVEEVGKYFAFTVTVQAVLEV